MVLRCTMDGLLLPAEVRAHVLGVVAYDGLEPFRLEAVEALFYEIVSATCEELLRLQRAGYRLLRPAADFQLCSP